MKVNGRHADEPKARIKIPLVRDAWAAITAPGDTDRYMAPVCSEQIRSNMSEQEIERAIWGTAFEGGTVSYVRQHRGSASYFTIYYTKSVDWSYDDAKNLAYKLGTSKIDFEHYPGETGYSEYTPGCSGNLRINIYHDEGLNDS